jgi:hypothetical protein
MSGTTRLPAAGNALKCRIRSLLVRYVTLQSPRRYLGWGQVTSKNSCYCTVLDTKRGSADASGAMTTKLIYLLSREGRHLLTRHTMLETSSHLDLRTQCGFYFTLWLT